MVKNKTQSAGARLRVALAREQPLQIAGTINAYCALLAQRAGFNAIYLSGAGVANASYGLPDLGYTSLENVAEDVRRITGACSLPLLVDADTAWGTPAQTIKTLLDAGAAGVHIEDQVDQKRCGHRPGKNLVSVEDMESRIKSAIAGRSDSDFVIMARTDAYTVEGLDASIQRSKAYISAGADMIFAEAFATLDEYRQFVEAVGVPVLANITEFGKTPLFTVSELGDAKVAMVLYPLSAFRAMSAAALNVYQNIRENGTQQSVLDTMQTRAELYDILDYESHEKTIDEQLAKERKQS
jgi:methylisocitrate lyase